MGQSSASARVQIHAAIAVVAVPLAAQADEDVAGGGQKAGGEHEDLADFGV